MKRDPIEDLKRQVRMAGGLEVTSTRKVLEFQFGPELADVLRIERSSGNPATDAKIGMRELRVFLQRRTPAAPAVDAVATPTGRRVEETPAAHEPVAPPLPIPALPAPPPVSSFQQRWEAAVAGATVARDKLQADLALAEKRLQMLSAMVPYMDDPTFEDTFRAVFPAPKELLPAVAAPVQRANVKVTREAVLEAVQLFEGQQFTVNQILDLMVAGREVNSLERKRIRLSVAACITALGESGQIQREPEAIGREILWSRSTQLPAMAMGSATNAHAAS
jgi:hypothetical protein